MSRLQAKLVQCPHCDDIFAPADLIPVPLGSGLCEHCGQWFESPQSKARFCSRRCQLANHRNTRK